MKYFVTALHLMIPLIVAGLFHMFAVRYRWFAFLARPIHEPSLGANKTWRGLIILPLGMFPGVLAARALEPLWSGNLLLSFQGHSTAWIGILVGLGYMVAELPNSYVKRKMGVAPGMLPDTRRQLFLFIDQVDSVIGAGAAYWFLLNPPWQSLLIFLALGPAVHLGINLMLYFSGIRKRPV